MTLLLFLMLFGHIGCEFIKRFNNNFNFDDKFMILGN